MMMTLVKLNDGTYAFLLDYKILFFADTMADVIALLTKGVEIPRKEVDDALVDLELQNNNVAEFGVNNKFLFSRWIPSAEELF